MAVPDIWLDPLDPLAATAAYWGGGAIGNPEAYGGNSVAALPPPTLGDIGLTPGAPAGGVPWGTVAMQPGWGDLARAPVPQGSVYAGQPMSLGQAAGGGGGFAGALRGALFGLGMGSPEGRQILDYATQQRQQDLAHQQQQFTNQMALRHQGLLESENARADLQNDLKMFSDLAQI